MIKKTRKEKRSYTHLDIEQRSVIEHNLDEGKPLSVIARKTGVSTSTIRRGILRNRRFDSTSNAKGKDPTDCVWLKSCKVKSFAAQATTVTRSCASAASGANAKESAKGLGVWGFGGLGVWEV